MIIIIKDGYDVIDNRPEAEIAQGQNVIITKINITVI